MAFFESYFAFDKGLEVHTLILESAPQIYFLRWAGKWGTCESSSLCAELLSNEGHTYAGIWKVLICSPFVCFRPFTPFLLLSGSFCSRANRSSSISAICTPEPADVPALHSVLPCWGSALHELHGVLPQVKQRRNQTGTKKSFCSKCTKLSRKNTVCHAKGLCYQDQLVEYLVQGNNFRMPRAFPSFRVFRVFLKHKSRGYSGNFFDVPLQFVCIVMPSVGADVCTISSHVRKETLGPFSEGVDRDLPL